MPENKEGVHIVATEDKRGTFHGNIYDKDPRDPSHTSIHVNINTDTGKGTIVDTTSGSKVPTDTQCFLTTACMKKMKNEFDDNCEELSILRWFRDKFVTQEDKYHYYETAPVIVEAISMQENENEIYEKIYATVIQPCVQSIKNGEYIQAYNRYTICILTLEEEFARKLLTDKLVKILKLT